MTRPTPAALAMARSTLPVKRVASVPMKPVGSSFAAALKTASVAQQARPAVTKTSAVTTVGGPAPMSRSEIAANAETLMGIPYVWGGNSTTGLDCSAFISKAWGVARHTTDNLSSIATPISKDELKQGDALNLTTARDEDGAGHVRMFDKWANPEHTRMWVYEETPPRSVHHVINWDPSYTPMRRMNTVDA